MRITTSAKIIIKEWLSIKKGEKLLIITDDIHLKEAEILKKKAENCGAFTVLIIVPKISEQNGTLFCTMEKLFTVFNIILGATNYSLLTCDAINKAIKNGTKYLSLPLATNSQKSLLTFDFLKMNTEKSKSMCDKILPILNESENIRITTALGTDLTFHKQNRNANFFNGKFHENSIFSSSSFEVYIAVEETKTNGIAYLDGSMGYLGLVKENIALKIENGKITEIQNNESGKLLKEYMNSFDDKNIFYVSELGIGMNTKAKCLGNSYIEDESAYGTFHIGVGRNLSLGGILNGKGHFDMVFLNPNIYAENKLIIENGKIL